MLSQRQIVEATGRAAEVLRGSGAKQRVEHEGYTRINPFLVAESAGVIVMLRPMDKLFGAFVRDEQSGILLNSERPAGLIQMTCAHELGHFFLGHGTTTDDQLDYRNSAGRKELEADWFAYSLVAPRWAIARIMRKKRWSAGHLLNPFVLYQLSLRLGISYKAAGWSLYRLGLMGRPEIENVLKVPPAAIKKSLLQRPLDNAYRDVWLMDDADRDLVLEPRVDDQIVMRLKNHSAAGYVWSTDEAAAEGFAIEPLLIAPEQQTDTGPMIGGGDNTLDYLVTHVPDPSFTPAHLHLAERKPWNLAAPPIDNYSTRTCHEQLHQGLSPAAKESLLRSAAKS